MKALSLPVSENKNFEAEFCSYVLTFADNCYSDSKISGVIVSTLSAIKTVKSDR